MSTKDRYEFLVEYRRKPNGDILTRIVKYYTDSYEKARNLVENDTKYLISYTLNSFNVEGLEPLSDADIECYICTNKRLYFSRFCKEHYKKINGIEDILLVNCE
jgi:hypothetical protein